MKKIYLIAGTWTESPLKNIGTFDLEKYLLNFLAKSTCCTKTLATDTITEATAAAGVTVDGVLLKDGGVTANSMFAGFYPVAASQALSGAGAVNVTSYLTKLTSTGVAEAITLANGTQIGQLKKIQHVVDGGSSVLTPVSLSGGTTITFTTAGEIAILLWNGTAWVALELNNTTAGGASPALA